MRFMNEKSMENDEEKCEREAFSEREKNNKNRLAFLDDDEDSVFMAP